jgi:hypothetical protein
LNHLSLLKLAFLHPPAMMTNLFEDIILPEVNLSDLKSVKAFNEARQKV